MAKNGGSRPGAGRPKGSRNYDYHSQIARALKDYGGDGKSCDVLWDRIVKLAMSDEKGINSHMLTLISKKLVPDLKSVDTNINIGGALTVTQISRTFVSADKEPNS